ncbi:hypothetical protein VTL71DRAFT_3467 [Oculimacula yallundae]|uniref:Uncharacterized protein n=1 Tax=Oculimacula yallundae TaxID=86028 RepID=A0ABR4C788_9HELO
MLTLRFYRQRIMAEAHLNATVTHAVMSVPCDFTELQREALKVAGIMGGLKKIYIRDRSASVAMAYHLDNESYVRRFEDFNGIVMVYDAVDSERELSLISTDHGFELLATVRDANTQQKGIEEYQARQQSILSSSTIIALVEKLLSEAKLKTNAVDDIVLSGDPSHLAKVRRVLETYFGKTPLAPTGFPIDHAIVYGSAILGYSIVVDGQITGCAGLTMDATLLDLGIETNTGAFAKVISRNTVYPTMKSIFVTTTEDGQENATIGILEGAGQSTLGTRKLGTLQLTGLPREQKGVLQIEVRFMIDANDNLYARAGLKGGSQHEELFIPRRENTPDEIERLSALLEDDVQQENDVQVVVKDGVDVYIPAMPKKGFYLLGW